MQYKTSAGLNRNISWCFRSSLTLGLQLVAAASLGLSGSRAMADVVITNTPNGTDGGSAINGTELKSLIFKTGATPALIQSIQLGLNPHLPTLPLPITRNITISLWSTTASAGGLINPSQILASSGSQAVTISALRQIYAFNGLSELGSFTLAGGTTYGLTLQAEGAGLAGIRWANTGSTGSATIKSPTGLNGYTFIAFSNSGDGGLTWGASSAISNTIILSVTPIELDGEAYAAFQSVGLNAMRLQREALLRQGGSCKANGWTVVDRSSQNVSGKASRRAKTPLCVFAAGGNSNSILNGSAGLNGYNSAIAGGFYGVEVKASRYWTVGGAYGYGTAALSDLGISKNNVSATINSAAIYGVFRPDSRLTLKALVGYSAFDLTGQRNPITIGHTNSIAGSAAAHGATAGFQADYVIPLGDQLSKIALQLKPILGLAYGSYQQNGFSESGDAIMNLNVSSHTSQSLVGTIGVELAAAIPLNSTRSQLLKPRLSVAYQVDALANSNGNTSLEVSLPGTAASAISNGLSRGANDLAIAASLDYVITKKASLYATASYEAFSTGSQLAYGGGARISF